MLELLIQSRIIEPKAPPNILQRPRLSDVMSRNKEKKIILIISPAGYGKTTLAQNFLQVEGLHSAWLHVTEDINNFFSFSSYLVHSLKKLNDGFGDNTFEVIESLKQSLPSGDLNTIVTTVISTFINEFCRCFKEETFMVIDDLHNAGDSEWLKLMFEKLIEDFPQNLHIIITTRSVPGFNLSKLAAKRDLFTLGPGDLNFNNDEITQLLKTVYLIKFSDNDIRLFLAKVSGWITGIHLLLQACGDDLSKAKLNAGTVPESIFDYFANDIFIKLPAETQSFLMKTAWLENFSAELCNHVLDISNSEQIIEQLIRKNIFIELTGGELQKIYNYHTLFRGFLISKNKEIIGKDENTKLLRTIYKYYKQSGNWQASVNYALACGDYNEALPVIKENSDEMFNEARYEILWKWLSALPENYFSSNPYLLFYKGKLLIIFKADINEAYRCLTECEKLAAEDEDLLTECVHETVNTLMLQGKAEESLNRLNNLLGRIKQPVNRAKILSVTGNVNYRIGPGKYNEIISTSNECLELCDKFGLNSVRTDVYNLLGTVYQDRGEFSKALFYYEYVVKNVTNIFRKFITLTNIVLLNASSGNFSKAKEFLDEAQKLFKQYTSLLFERYLLRTAALFRFEAGDYEECIRIYEKLNDIEIKHSVKQFVFWYYLIMGEAYSFLGNHGRTEKLYEFAVEYMDKNDEYEKIELELHKVLLKKKKEPDRKTEKALLDILKYYEDNNYVYSKVQLMLHIADYYYKSGMYESAANYIKQTLNSSAQNQYKSFLEQNYFEYRYLFDFAITNKIQPSFISDIHVSLLEKVNFTWLSDECRKRLARETEKLYDIKMKCFGGLELSVRSEPVPESKWIRKKSKLILVYLLLNKSSGFTKDKIMDLFFQELSADSAENVFHQAITNIRNAVKPAGMNIEAEKRKKKESFVPSYINYENKLLRLNKEYYYLIDADEFDKHYKKAKSSEANEDFIETSAKAAIELYTGEFLTGYYEPWIEDLRESYSNKYADMCSILVKQYKQKNEPFEITVYAGKLIDADKLNEDAYVEYIEASVKMGNVNQARNKFSSMLKIFDEELGEKPSKSALEKIQKILLQ